ncbi:hypothetical protein, partial [Streptomyces edwardsiae]
RGLMSSPAKVSFFMCVLFGGFDQMESAGGGDQRPSRARLFSSATRGRSRRMVSLCDRSSGPRYCPEASGRSEEVPERSFPNDGTIARSAFREKRFTIAPPFHVVAQVHVLMNPE